MRGRQWWPSARTLEERQHVEMSWYFRLVNVVASSIPITSYSRPRYASMSFSLWKCPAMMREPFANVSTPRYAANSCFNPLNNRFLKSSKCSMFALPTLRSKRHFNPGTRWQSSAPICASNQCDFPPPRAPP